MRYRAMLLASLGLAAAAPPPAYYDVNALGADPTGVADSVTAINNTITAACAQTPPVPVYLPPGTYTALATSVQPGCNGLVVYGAGRGVTTLQMSATKATGGLLAVTSHSNVTIRDLTIDGNVSGLTGTGGSLNNAILIPITKGNGVVLDNVVIQNTLGQALQFSDSLNSGIRRSTMSNISQYWHTNNTAPYIKQAITFVANGGQVTGSISADGNGTGTGTILRVTALTNASGVEVGSDVIAGTFPAGVVVAHVVPCVAGGSQTCSGVSSTGLYQVDTSLNYPAGTTLWLDPSGLYSNNFVQDVVVNNAGFDVVNGDWMTNFRVINLTCNLGSGTNNRASPSLQWANPTGTKNAAACVFLYGVRGLTLEGIDSEWASGNGFDLNGLLNTTIVGNRTNFSGATGILLSSGNSYGTPYGTRHFTVSGNIANDNQVSPYAPMPFQAGLTFSNANLASIAYFDGTVSGNVFSDEQATPTQQYGIASQGSGTTNVLDSTVKIPGTNTMLGNAVAPTLGVLALHNGNSLYSATATQTMAATTATTCFAAGGNGSQIIPQYAVAVGTKFQLSCRGNYTTPASSPGTMTVSLKLGSVVLASATSPTLAVSQTKSLFTANALCTVQAVGSSGSMMCNGAATFSDTNGVASTAPISPAAAATIDTTANGKLDMLFAWSTVAGAQTTTTTQANMEMLN